MKADPNHSLHVIGLHLEADGVYIVCSCAACGAQFVSYLTTLGSLALGQFHCPECGHSHDLCPEAFDAALRNLLPSLSRKEMIQMTDEATRITESWYRVGPMAELMSYQGINLGEGIERELMPIVMQGLYQARRAKRCEP